MSNDNQFLSFKGLKYYSPKKGWKDLNGTSLSSVNSSLNSESNCQMQKHETESVDKVVNSKSELFDPLMQDLFGRICIDFDDSLTSIWKSIADEVELLEQFIITSRDLLEELKLVDQEINELRGTIKGHLDEAQQLADQQIAVARLRAKVSAVAQSRLLVKLCQASTSSVKGSPLTNCEQVLEKS